MSGPHPRQTRSYAAVGRVVCEALDALLIAFIFYVLVVRTLGHVSMAIPVAAASLLYLLKRLLFDSGEDGRDDGRTADWLLLASAPAKAKSSQSAVRRRSTI